jgi:hypothetical protein
MGDMGFQAAKASADGVTWEDEPKGADHEVTEAHINGHVAPVTLIPLVDLR